MGFAKRGMVFRPQRSGADFHGADCKHFETSKAVERGASALAVET